MATFALIHPPLLCPQVWGPFAEYLESRGQGVVIPDFRGALDPSPKWWERATKVCVETIGRQEPMRLVCYSGSGVLAPLLATNLSVDSVIFMDAVVPAESGHSMPDAEIKEMVKLLARDGHFPKWTRWWEGPLLNAMLPEVALRQSIDENCPELPADFYEYGVPVPDNWAPPSVTYLQLSEGYTSYATEAARRGWDVKTLDGDHLYVASHPARVFKELGIG